MIQTPRTIIRPYTEEDIDYIYPVLSNPVTMGFWPSPFLREQVERWIRKNIMRSRKDGLARMIVESRETGEVIGDCGIVRNKINGKIENDLGYIIHHPFWRKGYATECATALIEWISVRADNHPPQRIIANMAVNHTGSRRVAEKIGMRLEGTFINERNRGMETCLYVMDV